MLQNDGRIFRQETEYESDDNDSLESLPTLASVFNLDVAQLLAELRSIEEVVQ